MPFPVTLLEIAEIDLCALAGAPRKPYDDLTAEQQGTVDAAWAEARTAADGLVRAKLGREPADATLAERLRQAGAVYLLSRRSNNVVPKDARDARRDHFQWLLGLASGADTGRVADPGAEPPASIHAAPLTFPAAL